MSAEILRKAASLMRERAEAANAGPWEAVNCEFQPKLGRYSLVHDGKQEVAIDRAGWRDADVLTANAEHIASWHPAVALAVADWLEFSAFTFESREAARGDVPTVAVNPYALAVATAYLGDAP